jgi:hypothetical protein
MCAIAFIERSLCAHIWRPLRMRRSLRRDERLGMRHDFAGVYCTALCGSGSSAENRRTAELLNRQIPIRRGKHACRSAAPCRHPDAAHRMNSTPHTANVLKYVGSCWLSGGREHHGPQQGRRDAFQIVRTFEHRDISGQEPFADPAKWPQKVAQSCPDTLDGVVVAFPNPISIIIITRPFPLAGRMADRLMDATSGAIA